MHKTLLTFFLFLAVSTLQSVETSSTILNPQEVVANELARLDQLIDATKQSLTQQERLREIIKQYQEMHRRYLDHPEDNELLYQLIKTAYIALDSIKKQHLELTVEPEFLSELSVLSKPAMKISIPKP